MQTIQSNKPFEVQILKLTEWQNRPVKNNFFEVVYIREGKGTQCINYNTYEYSGGNIFLLPPLRCHSFTIVEPTTFVFLKFTKGFFLRHDQSSANYENWFSEAAFVLANYQQQPGEIIRNEQERKNLIGIVDTITYEVQHQNQYTSELVRSLMVGILHLLLRNIKAQSFDTVKNDTQDHRLIDITDYIQANLSDPDKLKIDNLSKQFLISPTYIGEFFQKNIGYSLREYIAKSRLKLAEIRLLYSDFTLNDIAEELGFTDASHLSRTFKKYSGKTVRQFKKEGKYCLLKRA